MKQRIGECKKSKIPCFCATIQRVIAYINVYTYIFINALALSDHVILSYS